MDRTALSVATWNVNSIRRRLAGIERLAKEAAPDVICLQETKVADGLFPDLAIEAMGYPHRAVHGEKAYNGVAILSRLPFVSVATRRWCGRADARHVTAVVDAGGVLGEVEIHSLYVPAGGDIPDPSRNPKFAYKLRFLDAGAAWGRRRKGGRPALLCGDLNVAPLDCDVWSHERLRNVVTHTPVEIDRLERMRAGGGWIDAVRQAIPPPEPVFTWWSYRTPGWEDADKGRRLDHIWLSPELLPRLEAASVLRAARGWADPSDHVPVIVTLAPD